MISSLVLTPSQQRIQLKRRENVAVSTFSLLTENNGLDYHRIICLSGLPNIHLVQACSNNVTSAVALSNAPPRIDNNLTGFLEQSRHITRHSTTTLQDFQAGASLHVPQDVKIKSQVHMPLRHERIVRFRQWRKLNHAVLSYPASL